MLGSKNQPNTPPVLAVLAITIVAFLNGCLETGQAKCLIRAKVTTIVCQYIYVTLVHLKETYFEESNALWSWLLVEVQTHKSACMEVISKCAWEPIVCSYFSTIFSSRDWKNWVLRIYSHTFQMILGMPFVCRQTWIMNPELFSLSLLRIAHEYLASSSRFSLRLSHLGLFINPFTWLHEICTSLYSWISKVLVHKLMVEMIRLLLSNFEIAQFDLDQVRKIRGDWPRKYIQEVDLQPSLILLEMHGR